MKVLKIFLNDVANGPGIRVVVWCSGCSHKCPECHNPETWDYSLGHELTDNLIRSILRYCDKDYIQGLTITGGDPLDPVNIEGTLKLSKKFKERFPSKDLWVWTGYNLNPQDLSKYKDIDVIVDGPYNRKLKDVSHPYAGSSNQRVININKSIKQGEIQCIDFFSLAKAVQM